MPSPPGQHGNHRKFGAAKVEPSLAHWCDGFCIHGLLAWILKPIDVYSIYLYIYIHIVYIYIYIYIHIVYIYIWYMIYDICMHDIWHVFFRFFFCKIEQCSRRKGEKASTDEMENCFWHESYPILQGQQRIAVKWWSEQMQMRMTACPTTSLLSGWRGMTQDALHWGFKKYYVPWILLHRPCLKPCGTFVHSGFSCFCCMIEYTATRQRCLLHHAKTNQTCVSTLMRSFGKVPHDRCGFG